MEAQYGDFEVTNEYPTEAEIKEIFSQTKKLFTTKTKEKQCGNCYYWKQNTENIKGVCHRFPINEDVYSSDWCGEFAFSIAAIAARKKGKMADQKVLKFQSACIKQGLPK